MPGKLSIVALQSEVQHQFCVSRAWFYFYRGSDFSDVHYQDRVVEGMK